MGKKIFTQPNIYTICALLYLMLGDLISGIKIITLVSHGVFLVMSLYYIYAVLKECRLTIFIKALTILFAAFMFYGLIFLIVGTDSSWKVYVSPSWNLELYFRSFAPLYAYYYFGSKGMITEKWFRGIGVIFLFAVFCQYSAFSERAMIKYDSESGEFTNNAGYYWLAILPLVVFYRNRPIFSYSLMFFISIMIIGCMKRGAIIIGGIIDVYILFKLFKGSKHKTWIMIVSVIIIFLVGKYFMDFLALNDFANKRLEATLEGDSSQRDQIYAFYIDYFFHKTNALDFLIGGGACATGRIMGSAAHNDWLEIAICMGLFGVLLYVYYWIANVKTIKHAHRYSGNDSIVIILCVIMFSNFAKTLFSMSINDMMLCSNAMLGYCLSKVYGDEFLDNNNLVC